MKQFFFFGICAVSLFFLGNLGGELFFLPVNSLLFLSLSAFLIVCILFQHFDSPLWITPKLTAALVALLLLVAVVLLSEVNEPVEWGLRLGYLVFGLVLLWVLLQEPVARLYSYAHILLGFLLLHALVGMVQTFVGAEFSWLIPLNPQRTPVGIFQQVNVQASLMVTAIILAVYLLIYLQVHTIIKGFALLLLGVASLVLFASGSRVGLLGFVLALPLILIANSRYLLQHKGIFVGILLAVMIGSMAGVNLSDGFSHAHSKIERLAEQGQDVRPTIYRASWELFKDSPIHGHGIGSFSTVFHEKIAEKQAELGGVDIIGNQRFTHPHNEILFWAVEGGLLAVIGLLLFAGSVILALFQQGFRKGLTFFALLLPITLHTMVELPFYTSVFHWFIFIFILALLFKQSAYPVQLTLSQSMQWLIKGSATIVILLSMLFFATSFYISQQLPRIIYQGQGSLEQLYSFRKHPYFTDFAVRMTFANLALHERDEKGEEINRQYAQWMESYLQRVPDINVFIDLMRVYDYLSEQEKLRVIADRALYLFPEHPGIREVVDGIKN